MMKLSVLKKYACLGVLILALPTSYGDLVSPWLLPTNEQLYGYLVGEPGQDEKTRPERIFRLIEQGGFGGFSNEIIVILYKKAHGDTLRFYERKRVVEEQGSSVVLKLYNSAILPEDIKTETLVLMDSVQKFFATHKQGGPVEQSGDDRPDNSISFYDKGKWVVQKVNPVDIEHDKSLATLLELSRKLQKMNDAVFLLKRI